MGGGGSEQLAPGREQGTDHPAATRQGCRRGAGLEGWLPSEQGLRGSGVSDGRVLEARGGAGVGNVCGPGAASLQLPGPLCRLRAHAGRGVLAPEHSGVPSRPGRCTQGLTGYPQGQSPCAANTWVLPQRLLHRGWGFLLRCDDPVGGLRTESETTVWLGSSYGEAWPGYFPDLASFLSREGDVVPTVQAAVGTKRGDGERRTLTQTRCSRSASYYLATSAKTGSESFSSQASSVPKLSPQHPRTPGAAREPSVEQEPTCQRRQRHVLWAAHTSSLAHAALCRHTAHNQQAPVTSQVPDGPPGPGFRVRSQKWAPTEGPRKQEQRGRDHADAGWGHPRLPLLLWL
ncbi:uncharacterized protein LOC123946729 [Meles meles]|uniref:uncharacterized protein LOC123946729 n=1 Tax=Meles meles TaxID=9662 RepID=UPI001E6994F3|nr:uncharacterized protein LOC123946729 [Meles meles]